MDISKYWPFNIIEEIPRDSVLVIDTGKIISKKEATPKNIGKGYTFVGEYPLLASKDVFKKMKKAKDTNDPSLLPVNPSVKIPRGEILKLPPEIISLIYSNLSVRDILAFLNTKKELKKYADDPELWKALLQRDYPYVVLQYDDKNKEKYKHLVHMNTILRKFAPGWKYSKKILREFAARPLPYYPNIDEYITQAVSRKRSPNKEIEIVDLLPALWGTRKGTSRYDSHLAYLIQDAYKTMWSALENPDILDSLSHEDVQLISELFLEVLTFINYIDKRLNINLTNRREDILAMGPTFIKQLYDNAYEGKYNFETKDTSKLKALIDSVPISKKIDIEKFKKKLVALNARPISWYDNEWTDAVDIMYTSGRRLSGHNW